MKRFIFFLLFTGVLVGILFYRQEVGNFIYSKTGLDFYVEKEDRQVAFVEKTPDQNDKEQQEQTPSTQETQNNEEQQTSPNEENDLSDNLTGNNVVGLSYSSIETDPKTLSIYADCIYKVEVKSTQVSSTENILYTDCNVKVKKVYKGTKIKEAKLYAFGGNIGAGELKPGLFQNASSKTDEISDNVTGLVDFCEPLKVGQEYIVFVNNNSGILSPIAGNMSFFKIEGRKVKRISDKEENGNEFSMKLSDFEKEYLK